MKRRVERVAHAERVGRVGRVGRAERVATRPDPAPTPSHTRSPARVRAAPPPPLAWTFDGPLATCLADAEDALRRAIVQLDDVSGIAVAIDLSLPALAARAKAGDAVQPAWSAFVARISDRYGLPCPPRVRFRRDGGALITLVIVYRS